MAKIRQTDSAREDAGQWGAAGGRKSRQIRKLFGIICLLKLKILILSDPRLPLLDGCLPNRSACKCHQDMAQTCSQSFCRSQDGNHPQVHQQDRETDSSTDTENTFQQWKWTNYNHKQQGWIPQAWYWVTGAAPNEYILQIPFIWHLNTGKNNWWGQKSGCGSCRRREWVVLRGAQEGSGMLATFHFVWVLGV